MIHDFSNVPKEQAQQHVMNRAETIGHTIRTGVHSIQNIENLDDNLVQNIVETEIEFRKLKEVE